MFKVKELILDNKYIVSIIECVDKYIVEVIYNNNVLINNTFTNFVDAEKFYQEVINN
jgi:hypothetical protein